MIFYPVSRKHSEERLSSSPGSFYFLQGKNEREILPTNSTIINKRHRQLAIRSLLVAPSLAFFIFDPLLENKTNDDTVLHVDVKLRTGTCCLPL